MAQIPVLPVLHSHQFLPTSSFSTSKLPNELLTIIFRFLSFADLKNALLVCKRWREVAEHPAFWNKLKLVHRVGKSLDCGLVEVLTMARLQSLQDLTLNFHYMDQILWEDCVHFLQVVAGLCPSVKRLSWENGGKIAMTPNPITVDKRAQDLVAQLVNFEEVHIFSRSKQHQAINGINEAILRAASDVEESKLKVLTLVGDESIDPAVLAVAQEKLTIKIYNSALWTLGLTEEGLRLISTKKLNILASKKGLKRELLREVKKERRRLMDDYSNYSIDSIHHEVSALREWMEAAGTASR